MDFLVSAALSNAVVVCVLAPIVLAVDRLARRPALAHRLWLLLMIKLVAPPLMPLTLSWPVNSRPQPATSSAASADSSESRWGTIGSATAAAKPVQPLPPNPDLDTSGFPSRASRLAQSAAWHVTLSWGPSVASIWLTISGLWLIWTLAQLIRAHRRLGAVPAPPWEVQEVADEIARKLDLKGSPRVWFVPATMPPALWAVGRRSRLLIPEALWARLEEEQRAALLAHELAHYRRRDHWVRPLELFVRSLYWWLPVLWWVEQFLHEAEEQCCDAWVVWSMPASKRAYARTLLETIDFLAEVRPGLPLAASGFGTVAALKNRLSQIMRGRPPRKLSAAGSILVGAAALMVVPLAWRQEPDRGVPRGYRIIDLGPFRPIAINNVGQIVGSPIDLFKVRAHRWDGGRWIDLAGREDLSVTPTDINDRGQVTGWFENLLVPASQTATPSSIPNRDAKYSSPHAFRTAPDQRINLPTDDLGTLGGEESRGLVINNAGQVAGTSSLAPTSFREFGLSRAFRTASDRPINPRTDQLDHFDAQEVHHGILGVVLNNLGDAIVNINFDTYRPAFHAAPGRTIDSISAGLGQDAGPGTEVVVSGINDRHQVIARIHGQGYRDVGVSFRRDPGRRIELETDKIPRSFMPRVINNHGLILGTMDALFAQPFSGQGIYDGRQFHRLGELLPPGSNWTIVLAIDFNDRGQIIGTGITPYRKHHGFLLDPVPEPAWLPWLLTGTVLTGVGHAAGRVKTKQGSNQGNDPETCNPAAPKKGGTTRR